MAKVLVSLNREDYRFVADLARQEEREIHQQVTLILRNALRQNRGERQAEGATNGCAPA